MPEASLHVRPPPIQVLSHDAEVEGYRPPGCSLSRSCPGSVDRANHLWVARGELPAGARLHWSGRQADQAVYVLAGSLAFGDIRCDAGDAVLIDSGAVGEMTALTDSRVLHYGTTAAAPPADGPFGPVRRTGHAVHVIRQGEAVTSRSVGPDGTLYTLTHFADGSRETSRVALFTVAIVGRSFAGPHSHSQDELIHVLEGEVRSGTVRVPAGHTLAVAKDMRYSFRTECDTVFLNFRPDASFITIKGRTSLETVAAREHA